MCAGEKCVNVKISHFISFSKIRATITKMIARIMLKINTIGSSFRPKFGSAGETSNVPIYPAERFWQTPARTLNKAFWFLFAIVISITVSFPLPVFADVPGPSDWLGKIQIPGIQTGNIGFLGGSVVPFVINMLLFILMTASLIMLIIGGISWITSRGEKEGMAKAKGTVTYAIIGLVLGLASFLILNTVFYFLGLGPSIPGSCYASGLGCPPGFRP